MSAVAVHPSQIPGAMQTQLRRELADGALIEFEEAPVGWLKKDGDPRKASWRAYFYVPQPQCLACEGSGRVPSDKRVDGTVKCQPCKGTGDCKREQMISVTTLLDSICPKPGLPPWSEAHGIIGALEAVQTGLLDPRMSIVRPSKPGDHPAVQIVREAHLGADAARDEAADRGLDMHAFLEHYMRTGAPPSIRDYPLEQHGYVRAGAKWLLKHRPEPIDIEQLICDPVAGFAGRSDLVAMIGGLRTRVDFKTSEKAAIYSSSHLQVGLYERGAIACGDEPTDAQAIVVLAADGEFRPMPSEATPERVQTALDFYHSNKPVDSLCESANRAEKKARLA